MMFGLPYEFAVFYELLEKTDDEYWKYGVFSFFIDDEIFPARGSNYTLNMAFPELRDLRAPVRWCQPGGIDFTLDPLHIFTELAHSHGMWLPGDAEDAEDTAAVPLGVYLSPIEIEDTGFMLFYIPENHRQEYLVYSPDRGKTAKMKAVKRGTVLSVIEQLPDRDAI